MFNLFNDQQIAPTNTFGTYDPQSVRDLEAKELDDWGASNQRLLERLEAENAQLRRSAVELVLQIQVLRDDARALTA